MVTWVGATNGASAPAQPAHNVGDLVIVTVSGKPDTVGAGSLDQGFTRLGTYTGGTGSQGADTGAVYIQVFAKVATDTTTTAPTASGFSGSNNATWAIYALRPDSGYSWRDTIGASPSWVVSGSDTDTTADNLLAATTGAFSSGSEPDSANGDGLLLVGCAQSDAGTGAGTVTASATGLSSGTHTLRSYVETSVGNDSCSTGHTWLGFSGTPSTGIAISHTITGLSAPTGAVVAIALRQVLSSVSGSATLSATDSVTASGQVGAVSDAAVSGTSAITSSGLVGAVAAATLAATCAITATGLVGTASDATLTATASISADGSVQAANESSAEINATATITAEGTVARASDATLTGTAAITATGAVGVSSGATLTAAATLTATGFPGVASGTSITATAAITAAGQVDEVGSSGASVTATAQITAVGLVLSLDTDTSNADDGIDLDGTAEVAWEPAIVALSGAIGEQAVVAHVIDEAPGVGAAYVPAEFREEFLPAAYERVLIGDQDFTFFRDAPTTVDTLRLIDPLLYGSARITLPQVNPQFEQVGAGALAQIYDFAPVRVQLVLDGEIVDAAYYKGFVSKIDTDGPQLVLEVGGQAAGRLSGILVRPPVYRRKQDVEHILVDTLRDARVRAKKHDGLSGVSLIRRGGSDGLSIFNETLAVWAGSTGSPITFTPNADGVYRKMVKDTETVDFTAYIDESLVTQSLSRDLMEEWSRVFARGSTAAGELVTNIKTPGITQGEAPDFPLVSGVLEVGMDDADTTSGAGVTAVQQQLAIHNFYDVEDGTPGEYDAAVASAVQTFQLIAGLNVTGEVGSNTWDALWNLTAVGYSLDEAREYPTAEDPAVRKWNRTANGSKIEANPLFDPHKQPVDGDIEVGGPFTKGQIRDFAASKLAPEGGVWFGTLTFRSGLIRGDHNPGDPFTSADVADRRELKPNHRIKLPYFQGGIIVTLADAEHSPQQTQVAASTHPVTTMEFWNAMERRREAMANRTRAMSGHVRASQVTNDGPPPWDTRGGWIANKVALVSGWNEVPVPVGQAGIVQRIRVELEDAAEFACLLTQKPVSVDALNDRVEAPLTDPRPSSRPWFEQEAVVEWLDGRGKLDAWGTEKQPCGYDPSLKTDEFGPTAQPITGLFVETCGFNYETGSEPVLYLYVWVGNVNSLLPGRILRKQDTTDF